MELNRRDFLKGAVVTGALAAGGALAGCAPAAKEGNAANGTAAVPAEGAASEYLTAASATQKWAFEIPPEPITDIAETVEADVVVVGAGTAGLVTAYSALQQGHLLSPSPAAARTTPSTPSRWRRRASRARILTSS